ncbi:MAG: excinuclease ABC subunit UvrC [Clostridia bacterium]|nr:excinuclease ABC subunit UvrC [Clostridia bacterium]
MKYDRGDTIAALREKAMALPLLPGVYLMRDKSGRIIYVGKAKALKNRVSQYFGSPVGHSEKVRQMVAHVATFDYIVADSEFEALVLECSLIKQHAPKYNILLKDDKGYHYIRISPPPFSRIEVALQKADDGARYIGPYMSSYGIKQAVDEANKVFGLSTCRRTLCYGKKPPRTERPCLNHHIGQCCAPCTGRVTEADYAERVAGALDLLTRGSAAMLPALTREMEEAADRLDFEKAAKLRDRIAAIRRIDARQKVVMSRIKEQDVIAAVRSGGYTCFQVFRFHGGALTDREEWITEDREGEAADRSAFLQQYYLSRAVPPQITVDDLPEDAMLLERWLTESAGRRVRIHCPQKGEQAALVSMCRRNAAQHLADRLGMGGRETAALDELATLLGLSEPPRRIESYDISHTAGEDAVAGMVVFEDGKPKKSDYRRFTIREARGGDDPAAMREVLSRRLAEYREHQGEPGFGELPDLILLDGGEAQVQAVLPVLQEAGLAKLPLFGLVKDGHHRTRAVATNGGELAVQSHRAAYSLVSALQEEVHRYAIGFHRQKRSKKIATSLTSIEGVGATRATELLRRFGSVKAVAAATEEELLTVKGITRPVAKAIVAHFREDE